MNMSKSYTSQPAPNLLCGNSFSFDQGNYESPQKYVLQSRNESDPGSTCSSLGRNDKVSLVAFLSASRHEHNSTEQCRSRLEGNHSGPHESITALFILLGQCDPPVFLALTGQNQDSLCS